MARRPSNPEPELGPAVRVLVLAGKEHFLRQGYTDRLKAAVEQAGESVSVHRFDGGRDPVAEILDECRSFSLMGGHKVVVVDEAEKFVEKDNRPLIERYAASPADGCTLVLRAESWRTGKLDAMINAVGGFIACDTPKAPQAAGWAKARATRLHDTDMTDDAAVALVDRVGCELDALATEVDKLVAAAGGGVITVETVDEMTGKTREQEVWDIQRRLLEGDAGDALAYLNELITTSRQPPTLVRWAIVDLTRKLHAVALASETGGAGAVEGAGKALRLWGDSAGPIKRVGRSLGAARAAELLSAAVATDAGAKSGLGDETRGLEVLSLRVIDAVHAAPAR